MHRCAVALSCLLAPAMVVAADIPAHDAGARPDDGEGPPDFVLEYDLKEAFGQSPRWEDGPRLSIGFGEFGSNDFGIFTASFEDSDAEMLSISVDWQFPYHREMSSFGFYAAFGLNYTTYTWDTLTDQDFEATTIGPRVLVGYAWNLDKFRVELGLQGETGLGIGDDYSFLGQDFTGGWEPYFAAGAHLAGMYNFGEGTGLELGGFFQFDHRRVRLHYDNVLGGDFTDLAKGEAWQLGALVGWRF